MRSLFLGRSRRAFTLVELLVVIAIIGVLVAMLLPAVQAAREAARRMSCGNNMKQIGLALHNYHDTYKTFPPDAIWTARNRPPLAVQGEERNYTWIALILPFVEQGPLHSAINFKLPSMHTSQVVNGKHIRETILESFLCPSETAFRAPPHGFGYTNYAGNAGWDAHRRLVGDQRLAGVFTLLDNVGISDIKDGTSNVIAVGEVTSRSYCCSPDQWNASLARPRVGTGEPVFRSLIVATAAWIHAGPGGPPNDNWIEQAGGPLLRADGTVGALWGSWANPHGMIPVYYPHYAQNVEWPGASSNHPGGGNFCLADGSVRNISKTISVGGVGGAKGDPYGRWGNVWTAAHLIQGIPDKAAVKFD